MSNALRFRLLLAAMMAALAVPAVPTTAATAPPMTVMVDDDGRANVGNCRGSDMAFRHVARALAESPSHARVLVCPGTYHETLIMFRVGQRLLAATGRPAIVIHDTPGFGRTGLWIGAKGVAIQGFEIRPSGGERPCEQLPSLVFVGTHGEVRLIDNRFRPARQVSGDCGTFVFAVDAERDSYIHGVSVTAHGNVFRGHVVGISILDDGHGEPQVLVASHNRFLGPGTAIAFQGSEATIRDNVVEGEAGQAPFAGVWARANTGGTIEIARNTIRGASHGFLVSRMSATIEDNLMIGRGLDSAEQGLRLDGVYGEVRGNVVTGFGGEGIAADEDAKSGPGDVTFTDNDARGNAGTDCLDFTSGSGTAGTAHIWSGNFGHEDGPDGICEPGP